MPGPLAALGMQVGGQLVGAGIGKLLGRMNRIDPNDAYNNAPQLPEYSPEFSQAAIERAKVDGRVNDRRDSVLARILAQANSSPAMSANSSRNVAAANAQTSNMMNTIAGVEQNLDGYESQIEGRADDMEMQGRMRLAEIMQMNATARQQAAQNARLANQQVQASSMATGMGIGSQIGSGLVDYTMHKEMIKDNKERQNSLEEQIVGAQTKTQTMLNDFNTNLETMLQNNTGNTYQSLLPIINALRQMYPELPEFNFSE